jgi:hypothetical protein
MTDYDLAHKLAIPGMALRRSASQMGSHPETATKARPHGGGRAMHILMPLIVILLVIIAVITLDL